MAVNDPIADMLARVRNAANAKFAQVAVPHSVILESIARIMQGEGFIKTVEVAGEGIRKAILIDIKYTQDGKPVFRALKRTSRPGRRHYISAREIRPTRQGMGVAILSTSKGIMKDTDAKRHGLGGEVMCTMW